MKLHRAQESSPLQVIMLTKFSPACRDHSKKDEYSICLLNILSRQDILFARQPHSVQLAGLETLAGIFLDHICIKSKIVPLLLSHDLKLCRGF